jgi:hypothetical protein
VDWGSEAGGWEAVDEVAALAGGGERSETCRRWRASPRVVTRSAESLKCRT